MYSDRGDIPGSKRTRIGHLAAQTIDLLNETETHNKALAVKGRFIKSLYDDVLERSANPNGREYLVKLASQLAVDEKVAFLELVERIKLDSNRVEFATVVVDLFGIKQAWRKLDLANVLSAQVDWSGLWSLTKAAGKHKKKSIVWMKPSASERQLISAPKSFTEDQLSALTNLRAQIFLAAGTHFTEGSVSLERLSYEKAIPEFDSWAVSKKEIPEEILQVCRLSAQYTSLQMYTLHELIETIEGLLLIRNVQENMPPGPIQKRQTEAAMEMQRTQLANETAALLSNCSWEKAWYKLQDLNAQDGTVSENDIGKAELVEKTIEALKREVTIVSSLSTEPKHEGTGS